MSYQISTTPLSEANAQQLHQLLRQYCQRVQLPLEEAASEAELKAAAKEAPGCHQVCCLSELHDPENKLHGVILFYPTYSTWVGARLRLGVLQCESKLAGTQLLMGLLRSVIDRALDDEAMQRIELLQPASDAGMSALLARMGFVDMTRHEAWHFARLDEAGLRRLADRGSRRQQQDSGVASFTVRPAVESDCVEIMDMIRELADFEHLGDQVHISEPQLRRDIFGARRLGRLLIAEEAAQTAGVVEGAAQATAPIGYALAFDEFWHSGRGVCLEDVFVRPSHRRRGVCSALFAAVAADSLAAGARFMSLCFLAWNAAAFDVYRGYGFVDITEAQSVHFWRLTRPHFSEALSSNSAAE